MFMSLNWLLMERFIPLPLSNCQSYAVHGLACYRYANKPNKR